MRKALLIACCISLATSLSFAGKRFDLRNARPAPLAIDDGIARASTGNGQYIPGLDNPLVLNWVLVDSMANAFGPANDQVKPLAYDQASNTLVLIHRGAPPYGTSGQLWYNVSRNNGVSWYRAGELSGGTPQSLRYPSCTISNPAGTADTSQLLFVWAAPNLINGGAFGQITYGVDFPLGAGAGIATVDPATNDLTAALSIWSYPNSDWVNWASSRLASGIPNDHLTWRTNDYLTVIRQTPPHWRDTIPYFINSLGFVVGKATNQGGYFAVNGLFYPDSLANAFNVGYSRTTDNGATWGPWIRPQPDWGIATGLGAAYDLYDFAQPPGGTVDYNADMVIDANGMAHFFYPVADTPATDQQQRHLLEVYQTPTGWEAKFIKRNLARQTVLYYPSPTQGNLSQTNHSIQASISSDGQLMTFVWLEAASLSPNDTLPEIWFSYRRITDPSWSTPINISQTPDFAEMLLHAAPTVKWNGGNSYTLFLFRCYQAGINTWPPDNIMQTNVYVAAYTFTTTGVDEGGLEPSSFKLEQNYPNPFNPSTRIRFSIPKEAYVSLTVTNVLGQVVATPLNDYRTPGEYTVEFSPENLAGGVYYYTLRVGNQSQTKKMVYLR